MGNFGISATFLILYHNELIGEINVGSTSETNYERPGNTYEANIGSMSGQRWWPKLAADVGP